MVNGVLVDMTAEEIEARKAEEKAWLDGEADRDIKEQLLKLDAILPRYAEASAEAYYDGIKEKKAELRAKLK